jgi:predicted lipoprotein with Yx(FWY)xxD motif
MANGRLSGLLTTVVTTASLLVLGSCGAPTSGGSAPSPSAAAVSSASGAASPAATPSRAVPISLALADSRYGRIIVDGSGRALYLFDADHGPVSTCYNACASAWPPFLLTESPTVGSELAPALASTTTRKDGFQQVTYNGHPLYYYVGDRSPGEVRCQAAVEFGGGWYVIDGLGNRITAG